MPIVNGSGLRTVTIRAGLIDLFMVRASYTSKGTLDSIKTIIILLIWIEMKPLTSCV